MMRGHLDKTAVALARARLSVAVTQPVGRCAVRRSSDALDLTAADPQVLLACADSQRRARIVQCAAAARHGTEIARAVSGSARAELNHVMDDDIRRFALAHRTRHAPGQKGTLPDRFAASCAEIETLLRLRLAGKEAPDAALDAALTQ
jgi:hypothetical protein